MFKEEGVMNKSDLKDGMHVKLRNESIREYYKGYFIGVEYIELVYIDFYNTDLKHNTESELDIMKVFDEGNNNTIWQREEIDWSKVPIDAKVLVSSGGKHWFKRYFAKYENGMCCTFPDGFTSWTVREGYELIDWKYYKLAEEPKEEVTFDDVDEKMKLYCKENENICDRECTTCGMRYILDNYNVNKK